MPDSTSSVPTAGPASMSFEDLAALAKRMREQAIDDAAEVGHLATEPADHHGAEQHGSDAGLFRRAAKLFGHRVVFR